MSIISIRTKIKRRKAKLVKEEFNNRINVSDFNLLVGIIISTILNQKEFFIALCGCVPYPYNCMPVLSPYAAHIVWSENIKELVYEQEESGFEVVTKNIDNFPYPIIIVKEKNRLKSIFSYGMQFYILRNLVRL